MSRLERSLEASPSPLAATASRPSPLAATQPARRRGRAACRAITVALAMMLLSSLGAVSVRAGAPGPVDQSTLQPPLNPNFTYTCVRDDGGIICRGTYDPTYVNEPIGIFCDGREVHVTGGGHETLTRWHLPDGRATRTIASLHYVDRYSLSPTGGGRVAAGTGDWLRLYTYPNPGDKATRTFAEVGTMQRIADDTGHVFWLDRGVIRYVPGHEFETPASTRGRIDSWNDSAGAEARLCAALS
jgi:hypothetical protein